MASTALMIPADYSYVLASLLLSAAVNQYHTYSTMRARRAAKIDYPNAYATPAEAAASVAAYHFNCAQRAHANYIENLPQFLVSSAIAGLEYPRTTASLGAFWLVSRIVYTRGYVSSTPEMKGSGRYKGAATHLLAMLGLFSLSCTVVWKKVTVGL